jgi:hypothetical protein
MPHLIMEENSINAKKSNVGKIKSMPPYVIKKDVIKNVIKTEISHSFS